MKFFNHALALAFASYSLCALAQDQQNPAAPLSSEPSSPLEEMTVSSSRIEIPIRQVGASLSLITENDIELRGYQFLTDLLRTQTSIGASNAGGPGKQTSLRIRGEEGFQTLVMIDGIEVSDPSGTQVGPQLQHINAGGAIERVEILRGPQGFIYGADAGGVINIFTKESTDAVEGQFNIEAGRFDTQSIDAFIAGSRNDTSYFVSVNQLDTDGFNARSDDVSEDDDGYQNTTVHAKLGHQFNNALSLKLVGRSIRADTQFDNCGFPRSDDCEGEYDQNIAKIALSYESNITDQSVGYAYSEIDRENTADGILSFSHDGTLEKVEYLGTYTVGSSLKIATGAESRSEKSGSGDTREQRDQLGVFTELQAGIRDTWFFSLGGRYDDNDDFGTHTSLRASTAYIVPVGRNEMKLRSSFGTGFRAPSLSELAYNAGPFAFGNAATIELSEEQSSGFDLGVEFYFAEGASVKLGYYNQKIDDQIFFDLVSFSGYLQAEADTTSEGTEFELEAPISGSVNLFANFSYNKTQTLDDQPRIRRPKRLANVGLEATLLSNKLSILGNLRIARDAQNEIFGVGRVDLDDYEVLDLSVKYNVLESTSIFLRIENLLDEDYEEVTGFNTAGRSAYVSAQYTF